MLYGCILGGTRVHWIFKITSVSLSLLWILYINSNKQIPVYFLHTQVVILGYGKLNINLVPRVLILSGERGSRPWVRGWLNMRLRSRASVEYLKIVTAPRSLRAFITWSIGYSKQDGAKCFESFAIARYFSVEIEGFTNAQKFERQNKTRWACVKFFINTMVQLKCHFYFGTTFEYTAMLKYCIGATYSKFVPSCNSDSGIISTRL